MCNTYINQSKISKTETNTIKAVDKSSNCDKLRPMKIQGIKPNLTDKKRLLRDIDYDSIK